MNYVDVALFFLRTILHKTLNYYLFCSCKIAFYKKSQTKNKLLNSCKIPLVNGNFGVWNQVLYIVFWWFIIMRVNPFFVACIAVLTATLHISWTIYFVKGWYLFAGKYKSSAHPKWANFLTIFDSYFYIPRRLVFISIYKLKLNH